ncbi:Xaa-Pro dipeptidase [Halomonas shengliensis]|uniref:Xaa-Pro dipeptidase n=1 Tax=Halomonas shengliensis TaxID=419597 RepID=A0A1H0GHZ8_9GAMM|nr:Xaa-Pro dipeptidase [Halomonas shengliensis]SDO06520.1 Xaa-Pro dipeptidase [Halomonas shengliensis]
MTQDLDTLQARHLDALLAAYAETLGHQALDGVLIHSGRPRCHLGDDQEASFVAYGHFVHWTGQAHLAHSWLLVRPGQTPRLYLHAPEDFWHLPAALPDEPWVNRFEVERGRFETPPALPGGRFAVIGDIEAGEARALGAEANPPALLAALDEGRVRKSAYEVACIHEANRQALAGHAAARRRFLEGGAELDIQLAYLGASRQREGELPYANIVGVNAHGGVLHYQHYDRQAPARRHSLLVDAGHRHRGLCADITRTWAGPDADPAFAPLIEGVTAIKDRLAAALSPGVEFVALQERMHRELAELLVDQGIVRGSAEGAVESGLTRAFCPHGLGHLLGVQVHDVAGRVDAAGRPLPPPEAHPALRLTRRLEAGMVVTIEPGLYVIPMLLAAHRGRDDVDWGRVERLADHGGIRIEDNLAITAEGATNLTPALPD